MSAYGGVWWRVSFLWRTWAPGAAAFVTAVPVYAFSDVGILLPIGLVFCAFFGLAILGVAWHIASSERRRMTAGRTLIYAALVVFQAGAVLTIMSYDALMSVRWTAALRELTSDSIDRVAVRSELSREDVVSLRDPKAIQSFLDACRDAKAAFFVGRGRSTEHWKVVLEGPRTVEIVCYHNEHWPEHVVGHFVSGSFVSQDLRRWFLKNVAGPDGTPVTASSADDG